MRCHTNSQSGAQRVVSERWSGDSACGSKVGSKMVCNEVCLHADSACIQRGATKKPRMEQGCGNGRATLVVCVHRTPGMRENVCVLYEGWCKPSDPKARHNAVLVSLLLSWQVRWLITAGFAAGTSQPSALSQCVFNQYHSPSPRTHQRSCRRRSREQTRSRRSGRSKEPVGEKKTKR